MAIEGIISKVKKLLARTRNNPSQSEAENSMLLAQRLLAKHDLTMDDVSYTESKLKEVVDTGVSDFTGRLIWWQKQLATVIADNFRCKAYIQKGGRRRSRICYIGLKSDVEIAREVFSFAVDAIQYNVKQYVSSLEYSEDWYLYENTNKTGIRNDYIRGFISGLHTKFKEQVEQNEWGLILVKDPAVSKAVKEKGLRKGRTSRVTTGESDKAYASGYRKGRLFTSKAGRLTE